MASKWTPDGSILRLETPAYRAVLIKGIELTVPLDVELEVDGVRRFATFFTLDSMRTIMRSWEETGECLGGKYFWAVNPIVITSLELDYIENVLSDLVSSGEYRSAFNVEV